MGTYKELSDSDIRATRSFLNQLVDFVEQDISGSSTRKSYQVFVTGGIGPGVTSSLFQTVFDQDYSWFIFGICYSCNGFNWSRC